jgi:hypothetical protein
VNSNLTKEDLKRRRALFGSMRDGLRPLKPYWWRGKNGLLEIPVTTMPLLRLPIHLSYVLYLSTFSPTLALWYFRCAISLCRLTGVCPSVLLHPLDFLGREDSAGIEFFPAMNINSEQKLEVLSKALAIYCEQFNVVTMKEVALQIAAASQTDVVEHYVARSIGTVRK